VGLEKVACWSGNISEMRKDMGKSYYGRPIEISALSNATIPNPLQPPLP